MRWWKREVKEPVASWPPAPTRGEPADEDAVLRRGQEAGHLLGSQLLSETLHRLRTECFERMTAGPTEREVMDARADLLATGRVTARLRAVFEEAKVVNTVREQRKNRAEYEASLRGRPPL